VVESTRLARARVALSHAITLLNEAEKYKHVGAEAALKRANELLRAASDEYRASLREAVKTGTMHRSA
jgi:hypothetical protein